ncbi:carboxymuconolactone decarboxylase family protein [Nonomuraea dietziae]
MWIPAWPPSLRTSSPSAGPARTSASANVRSPAWWSTSSTRRGPSLRLHAELVREAGATEETLRDLLRGVAEFGMPRAWAAAQVLLPKPGESA